MVVSAFMLREKNRSWCTSSNANDQRAVTIECASDTKRTVHDEQPVYATLIKLCTDICRRNGKRPSSCGWEIRTRPLPTTPPLMKWSLPFTAGLPISPAPATGCTEGWATLPARLLLLLGGTTEAPAKPAEPEQPKAQIYRVRKTWADAKSQVGAYKVLANAKISADAHPGYSVFDADGNVVYPVEQKVETPAVPFRVWVKVTDLNIRKGPGTNYDATGRFTGKGVFTIVAVQPGEGSSAGWGRLKSGAGWISLDYATTI